MNEVDIARLTHMILLAEHNQRAAEGPVERPRVFLFVPMSDRLSPQVAAEVDHVNGLFETHYEYMRVATMSPSRRIRRAAHADAGRMLGIIQGHLISMLHGLRKAREELGGEYQ